MKWRNSISQFMLVLCFFASTPVLSQQIILVDQGEEIVAEVSLAQLNRISVVDDRIIQVMHRTGAFSVETDKVNGDIYVMLNSKIAHQIVSLFIVTEKKRRYQLTLMPKPIRSQSITLRPRDLMLKFSKDSIKESAVDEILKLVQYVWRNEPINGYQKVHSPSQRSVSVQSIEIHSTEDWIGQSLRAEKITIKNTSDTLVELTESMFWKSGIRAVSLSNSQIAPKQQCEAILVREVD